MIIVTGADGFIGKNLVDALEATNKEVIRLDINNRYVPFTARYADFKHGDIEHVYHLGAISSTTETDLNLIFQNNIKYSIDLFELCIEHQVPISYASSASVYGNTSDYTINPLNYYAMSKATVDLWVKDNVSRFDLVRGYRFFNVYGQGEDHKGSQASPVHTFIKQAKESGIVRVFDSSGDGIRDFIHVNDVCRTMLADTRESGIYDLGTGKSVSFSRLGAVVAKKFNATLEVIPFPDHLKNKYQFHTKSSICDNKCIGVLDYIASL